MKYRKLIAFGKGGYVLSMPKEWVVQNNLEKGSLITIQKEGNTLNLLPQETQIIKKKKQTDTVIDIDEIPNIKIVEKLISAYLNNYSITIVKGFDLIKKNKLIKKLARSLIGWEIIESSKEKFVLKNFLDATSYKLEDNLRKMDLAIRSIFEDLKKVEKESLTNLLSRINDTRRNYFLALKIIKECINNQELLTELKLKTEDLHTYWHHVFSLRYITQGLRRIVLLMMQTTFPKETLKDLGNLIGDVGNVYNKTMRAYYKQNEKLAYEVLQIKNKTVKKCRQLNEKHYDVKNIPIILERVRLIANTCQRILQRVYS